MLLNGRTWGDFWGNFTHYNNNGGASAIDISFSSCDILKNITNFWVSPQIEIFSHCGITAESENYPVYFVNKEEKETYEWSNIRQNNYHWDNFSKEKFKETMESDAVKTLIDEAHQLLDAGLVESSGNKIQEIFEKVATFSLKSKISTNQKNSTKKHSKSKKKWYDNECKKLKNKTRNLANWKNKKPHDNQIRLEYKEFLKAYKKYAVRREANFGKIKVLSFLTHYK